MFPAFSLKFYRGLRNRGALRPNRRKLTLWKAIMDWLVTTEWLEKHADASNIVILDCTWFVPDSEKNGFDEFLKSHIPTAQFIDLNVISDPKSPYANMHHTKLVRK